MISTKPKAANNPLGKLELSCCPAAGFTTLAGLGVEACGMADAETIADAEVAGADTAAGTDEATVTGVIPNSDNCDSSATNSFCNCLI